MKNTIKILTYINRLLMFFTCGLLISFYLSLYGMYAEILLGAFHVLAALVLLGFWAKLNDVEVKRIASYVIMVVLYFTLWHLLNITGNTDSFYIPIIWIIIIPMSLAAYLTFILEKIKIRLT